jgi:MFS family permease
MKKLKIKFNKVVLLLTLADIFTWGPLFVISAFSGIYLSDKLGRNTIEFVGIGTGISYITRAIFQIPVGTLTDRIKKDKDEIIILAIGAFLTGLPFVFYPLITSTWHYFLLQFIFGIGISLNVVNWRKLFAVNVTKGTEGKEYAVYDTALSISTAILSVILGIIANLGDKYFDIVMISAGVIMILASVWILLISKVKGRKSG